MDYSTIKIVHQTAVALSFAGFFARGLGAVLKASWVRGRAAKTLPHLIDTVLLASAVALLWRLRLDPLSAPWLMAKILALLLYIALGMIALGRRGSSPVRTSAWIGALGCFGYIVSVALSKDPAWFLR
jgi:uncharacterized membrane protein SirB2